jgi:diguanylate cyclase (GGDEF)-like protein
MMIMQDKSSELATSHQVAVARAADERASQAEPSASASAEQEVEALRATRLKLAGVIAALKAGFENLRQGFLVLDDDWRIMMFNERINEIVGCPPGVVREGAHLYELAAATAMLGLYPGDTLQLAWQRWCGRLHKNVPGRHFTRLSDARTMEVSYSPFGASGWIISYEDVSARVNAEKALAEQNERLDVALTNIPQAVVMFDADDRLILCNANYVEMLALPPELTLAGTSLRRILEHLDRTGGAPIRMADYYDFSSEARAADGARRTRLELRDDRVVQIVHCSLRGGGYLRTLEDITQAVRAEERIRHMGSHDSLTGLPNRSAIQQRIGEAVARARRGSSFCLHYLDLDHFKSANDTHGHLAGDLLLKAAAARIRSCLRETDTLARWGGDEFVVLQGETERPELAGDLARRLIEAISAPFDVEERHICLGLSIGVAVCPHDGGDAETLLRNADMAMYRAKTEGRSTYRFFEAAMDARLQQRRILEQDLKRAVADGEFELFYQPQVDAGTEMITGCEALLRWNHPIRGMVSPAEFIPVAEEIGVIGSLGAWVIQKACHDAATWPNNISVAINLSPMQFRGHGLTQTVIAALESSRLSPNRLEFEITESALLMDNESTVATLKHLRGLGVRIAMDDFGTGYSSLSYLRSFPFDKIKIDRSFIKDLGEDKESAAIVKAIVGLGVSLGMATTAEGVETVEQLRRIREQGCTEVQGYYFGRPCPIDDLRALLSAREAAA